MPIVLKSSDGETFEMEEAEAQLSPLIKRRIEEDPAKTCISIPDITGNILSRVIDYCRNHVNAADDNEALKSFDREFVIVDQETLVHLGKAARFLKIKSMLMLVGGALTDQIMDICVEEIYKMLKIEKPEEESKVYWGNEWTFDETNSSD